MGTRHPREGSGDLPTKTSAGGHLGQHRESAGFVPQQYYRASRCQRRQTLT